MLDILKCVMYLVLFCGTKSEVFGNLVRWVPTKLVPGNTFFVNTYLPDRTNVYVHHTIDSPESCKIIETQTFERTIDTILEEKEEGKKQFRNDYTYDYRTDGWFKAHPMPVDWHTARLICHSEGAELVSPLNDNMLISINELITYRTPKLDKYFSGVHQTFGDGIYTSVQGVPLEKLYTPHWSEGKPENHGKNHQCLIYTSNKTISDYDCNNYLPYICFRKFSDNDKLTECGTVDKEYKLNNMTGSCYKFHKNAEIWERAHKICQAEGGHLAIINSYKEAEALRNIFIMNSRAYYTPITNVIAIGFREWGQDGSWWTVHGQTLAEAGFERWGNGLPEYIINPETGSRQSCGGFKNEELDNIWCDIRYGFLCEKAPDSLTK